MTDPILLHIIREGGRLISDPATWIQHDLAKDSDGGSCKPWEPQAVRFCAFGALLKAAYDTSGDQDVAWHSAHSAAAVLLAKCADVDADAPESLFEINDLLGRRAILQLFNAALASYSASARAELNTGRA